MPRSKSSARWLNDHHRDRFVRRARETGQRSRAVFKLEEIQRRDRILRPGMVVVDLGAAPGGWSQLAVSEVKPAGTVVAVDLLAMEPIADVRFIQGDFSEEAVLEQLRAALAGARVDLVLSDMAPNLSGIRSADQARAVTLAELALDFAEEVCRPGGALLVKVFEGAGLEQFRARLRRSFGRVAVRKPAASRQRSRELYLLARDYTV